MIIICDVVYEKEVNVRKHVFQKIAVKVHVLTAHHRCVGVAASPFHLFNYTLTLSSVCLLHPLEAALFNLRCCEGS